MDLERLAAKLEFKSFISSLAGLSSLEMMKQSEELLKKFIALYGAAIGDSKYKWPISFYYVYFEMTNEDSRSSVFIDKDWFNKVELFKDMGCRVGIDTPLREGYIFLSYLLNACGSFHVIDKTFTMVRIFLAPEKFREFNTPLMDLLRELELA